MPEYLLMDGPLAGQLLACADEPVPGDLLAVEVVDVGQDLAPRHDYVVEAAAHGRRPGRLRHLRTEHAA